MQGPIWEGFKEVARWVALFVASFIITETLKQISSVPEYYNLNIWVLHYSIPVQLTLNFILTFAGRWVDKAIFIADKEKLEKKSATTKEAPSGLIPF